MSSAGPGVVVAVNGTSASAKSSTSRAVARRLGLRYLDTGAMYLAVTWWMLRHGVDVHDPHAVAARCEEPRIESGTDPERPTITVDGEDVAVAIRGDDVNAAVSPVSAVPEVRARMLVRQREVIEDVTRESPIVLATGGGAILLPENRKVLHERGFVVYLETSLEQQADRVRQGRNRPLLHDVDPLTKLTELMVIRAPLYESLADFTIATDGRKVHVVADAILAAFKAAEVAP